MGHYDKQREEMAAESRQLTEKRQSQCNHNWKPIGCDHTGKTTRIACTICDLNKKV